MAQQLLRLVQDGGRRALSSVPSALHAKPGFQKAVDTPRYPTTSDEQIAASYSLFNTHHGSGYGKNDVYPTSFDPTNRQSTVEGIIGMGRKDPVRDDLRRAYQDADKSIPSIVSPVADPKQRAEQAYDLREQNLRDTRRADPDQATSNLLDLQSLVFPKPSFEDMFAAYGGDKDPEAAARRIVGSAANPQKLVKE